MLLLDTFAAQPGVTNATALGRHHVFAGCYIYHAVYDCALHLPCRPRAHPRTTLT